MNINLYKSLSNARNNWLPQFIYIQTITLITLKKPKIINVGETKINIHGIFKSLLRYIQLFVTYKMVVEISV